MATPENWLLSERLRTLAAEALGDEGAWTRMEQVLEEAGAAEDADLMLPVLERSLPELEGLLQGFATGRIPLPEWDQAVLTRAMKAYKKRLKLTRLEDEFTGSRNPLSKGVSSSIVGVRPPEQYAQEIWDLLVQRGRLRDGGHGLLELGSD